jgi:Uma2 family endonuclease
MAAHMAQNRLGEIFMAGTGFLLARDPDTVRAPDIAFVRKDQPPAELPEEAFCPGSPDLAVEVVSPGDPFREVEEKVQAWLDAGTAMVWVVNPKWRTVSVYRPASDIRTLTENDELDGGGVLPGFRGRVGEIFSHP